MIHSGVYPVLPDHRDYSYPRTFGAVTVFAENMNLDAGFGFPNQDKDGYPYGCTGYAQSEVAQDEDKIKYYPWYPYNKTRVMEGTWPEDVGCDIRDSLNSTIVYGLLADGELTDEQAGYHRRGAFYNVVDSPDLDAFDDVRSAIVTNNRTVSVATPWFPEWEGQLNLGIVPFPLSKPTSYHNWKICGWKTIAGQPYLIGKSWQGPEYGDGGYHYVSRDTFNYIAKMDGFGAFTLRKADAGDYQRVKLAILEQVFSYIRLWFSKLLGR